MLEMLGVFLKLVKRNIVVHTVFMESKTTFHEYNRPDEMAILLQFQHDPGLPSYSLLIGFIDYLGRGERPHSYHDSVNESGANVLLKCMKIHGH